MCWEEGSPPRMRGKRSTLPLLGRVLRITPAHAGKTATGHAILCRGWDHPRACGENYGFEGKIIYRQGSPPRMRGKRYL